MAEFFDTLSNIVNDLSLQSNEEILLRGDFNIHYGKTGDPNVTQLTDFEHLTNLSQKIISPTNILDLIYTNSEHIVDAGVLDIFFSDHSLVFCTRKKVKQHFEYNNFKGRRYRNYNRDFLQIFLNDVDWNWSFTNQNDCWLFMFNNISLCLDNMCPMRRRKNRVNNNPWLK